MYKILTEIILGWQIDNRNYQVTNDNKISTKVTSDPSILYSSGAQFGPGHSIEFTVQKKRFLRIPLVIILHFQVIEAKEGLSDEGFGLVCKKLPGDALFQTGSLILNAQGMKYSCDC